MKVKLNAKQLRDLHSSKKLPEIKRKPLYLILDTIYDTYNIGGLFRLADALAVKKLYICGDSETPPNHKIKKASVGTYKIVPWEYKETAAEAIQEIKKVDPNTQICAIEQDNRSISYTENNYTAPLALIIGNETHGVSPEALDLCDNILEIPMHGINISLNVIVSAAIVSYHVLSLDIV